MHQRLPPADLLRATLTEKARTGAPGEWLLRARLREAARLLVETRAPVTEVSLEVGFGDLSHFTRAFRAEFGAAPGRYRAWRPASGSVGQGHALVAE